MANIEWNELDDRAVKVAKVLAADAVEKVGNGHPGTAISIAPAAYTIFQKFLKFNPKDTTWRGRDRFILSIGHSSLTQYIELYLAGAGVELDDLKQFRTFGSLTPGHPEYGHTKGIEITTGPLGQGLASAVGFAYAQRFERGLFDPESAPGESIFDHNIYVICGDGDLQEGLTSEAGSLAGLQKLGNVIVIWDDNHITIEGDTKISFQEDVLKRYEAYGWHTQRVDWTNGGTEYKEDTLALADAIENAKAETGKPSIIALKTLIAYPTPTKTGDESSHGSKLGAEAVAGLKEVLGFDPKVNFPEEFDVLTYTRQAGERGQKLQDEWETQLDAWKAANPDRAKLYTRLYEEGEVVTNNSPKKFLGDLPAELDDAIKNIANSFEPGSSLATRASSGQVIQEIAKVMPEFWGGSADLGGSNNTTIKGAASFGPDSAKTKNWEVSPYGRVLHFGIREHAMGQIINGIVLDTNTRAFGGTFFMFADYMRDSARIAALQGIPSVFVWSHDSIAVGEDGPTHQPVEHLSSMRAIPNFDVVRPADGAEVAYCWKTILENKHNPAGLILSRQGVPNLDHAGDFGCACQVKHGFYIYKDCEGTPDVILIGTGSELYLAVEAAEKLEAEGKKVRVVSAPCQEWFEKESDEYKESVLPSNVKARVTVEAGIAQSWYKYLGCAGVPVSLEHFGASGAGDVLYKEFDITTDAVVKAANESISKANK
ncbi:MAG: transketolase [Candidatus Ancillula sp.]|jgi:transketolase|nr:transketolase [Candidatus Ancillula sp.]